MDELSALLLYFIGVNMIAFIIMRIDKQKARKQQWRIPERTIWSLAVLGGALGVLIGMKTFRHKTKHSSFIIGMPTLFIIHIIIFLYIYFPLS